MRTRHLARRSTKTRRTLHIAHSPDSDDAFMFYALATGKLEDPNLNFVHVLDDIETLNGAALEGRFEVTAVSVHAYAYLAERYALLDSGASMGEGYGPLLVARRPFRPEEVGRRLVGVPGERTSAFLALKLYEPSVSHRVLPFDRIIDAVLAGEVDAGLLIHEGQVNYASFGLSKVLDLGEWWMQATGLPLPLGGNAVRRDLGEPLMGRISRLLKESILYALEHREEALQYALQFGQGLNFEQGDRFVRMYVNQRTLDYGEDGRRAVQLFLDRGYQAGLIPRPIRVGFV